MARPSRLARKNSICSGTASKLIVFLPYTESSSSNGHLGSWPRSTSNKIPARMNYDMYTILVPKKTRHAHKRGGGNWPSHLERVNPGAILQVVSSRSLKGLLLLTEVPGRHFCPRKCHLSPLSRAMTSSYLAIDRNPRRSRPAMRLIKCNCCYLMSQTWQLPGQGLLGLELGDVFTLRFPVPKIHHYPERAAAECCVAITRANL